MTPARSLVLFDIDGTLMRGAGDLHRRALVDGIRRVTGHTTTLDGISTAGMLDSDLIRTMLEAQGVARAQIEETLIEIFAACQSCYGETCCADLSRFVCPGVRETLAAMRERGVALGLVTGNLSSIGWRKMELAGLRSNFSVAAFSEDGSTRSELAGLAAERAIKRGLVEQGSKISLVGDHGNDVLAAKANGFQAIAVATGMMPIDELRAFEPDVLVEHLGELRVQVVLRD